MGDWVGRSGRVLRVLNQIHLDKTMSSTVCKRTSQVVSRDDIVSLKGLCRRDRCLNEETPHINISISPGRE